MNNTNTGQHKWHNKVSHASQLGGIETSVLDNGLGRGSRIAWINTGTGLRYKILLDRGMDIADAFFNQYGLAWISHTGVTPPQPFIYHGIDWLKTFTGGLLTTCGLTHVGGPETDEFGERGLHGEIGNTPAEIISIIQPDIASGNLEMSITGSMLQTKVFGPTVELRRTISGKIGEPVIRIHDEVINRGNTSAPHMLLYHFNLGWPLVDEGADIVWRGKWETRHKHLEYKIFNDQHNFRKCPPPLKIHNGTGEEVAFIDIEADESGISTCGLHNEEIGIALAFRFKKEQLPWLINWQHWGEGEYVTGIEPATHPPIGQSAARQQNTLIFIEPGEKKVYDVEIEILSNKTTMNEFMQHGEH
jgi:hypothetical protein